MEQKYNNLCDKFMMDVPSKNHNLFSIAEGCYWFCADYHTGQSSELYELLCKNEFHPGPMVNKPEYPASDIYSFLASLNENDSIDTVKEYLDMVNKLWDNDN